MVQYYMPIVLYGMLSIHIWPDQESERICEQAIIYLIMEVIKI